MSRIRVYITPFNPDGTYASDSIEVTSDVLSNISTISRQVDGSDFDIGVIRNSSVNITLRNNHGRYSDIGESVNSIFNFKRSDSKVTITWDFADREFFAGADMADGTTAISNEQTVIVGLLNDEGSKQGLSDELISFQVLGRESIFDRITSDLTGLVDTDTVSTILEQILNVSGVTDLLTFDALSINPSNDISIDNISEYDNSTIREVLDELLLASNSVLFLQGDDIVVKDRSPTLTIQSNFYGQASEAGRENVINISGIVNGLTRTINVLTWGDRVSQNAVSVSKFGTKKKDISISSITTEAVQDSVMDAIRDEFALPRQEFNLRTPLSYSALDGELFDLISIDYPSIIIYNDVSYYGSAVHGVDTYAKEIQSFEISPLAEYKIIGKKTHLVDSYIEYRMRAV